MNQHLSHTITAKIESFPTLPTVVSMVMDVTADPDSSTEDLMNVISQDPSLATTILKMANSAFFGMIRKISSLKQAISILGFKSIRNMVLAKSVFESFKMLNSGDEFDIRNFWDHSLLCALAAKVVASKFKGDKSELFVGGLIHDIGKLVIYMALPMQFRDAVELSRSSSLESFKAEQKVLGIAHDEVGMALLNRWLFPESLVYAVGYHHRPHLVEKPSSLCLAIHVADLLANAHGLKKKNGDGPTELTISPEAMALFDSYEIDWDESDLPDLQQDLAELDEAEGDTFNRLFS